MEPRRGVIRDLVVATATGRTGGQSHVPGRPNHAASTAQVEATRRPDRHRAGRPAPLDDPELLELDVRELVLARDVPAGLAWVHLEIAVEDHLGRDAVEVLLGVWDPRPFDELGVQAVFREDEPLVAKR